MEKQITITPQQMTEVIHKVTSGDRIKPIMDKAPVLSLAFTLFGAELMRILFDIKEEQK
jgi:hypothetical protein